MVNMLSLTINVSKDINSHTITQELISSRVEAYGYILDSCINEKALAQGKQIHSHMLVSGIVINAFLGTKLINLYANCDFCAAMALQCKWVEEAQNISTLGIISYSLFGIGLLMHSMQNPAKVPKKTEENLQKYWRCFEPANAYSSRIFSSNRSGNRLDMRC
ncbi:hypothetical protein SUGI_1144040 [Cryptomeria japonica]|nr:hypothetical protein SUGI_1144040 [Cryptomeria japonica]